MEGRYCHTLPAEEQEVPRTKEDGHYCDNVLSHGPAEGPARQDPDHTQVTNK